MDAQARNRAPRELPSDTRNHVIITHHDPVTSALIEKLISHKKEYVVVVDELQRALELYDKNIRVAIGDIDDPKTYSNLRAQNAALVVATNSDQMNTNITLTLREEFEFLPIVTTAEAPHSVDILQLAGSSRVLQLYDLLGSTLRPGPSRAIVNRMSSVATSSLSLRRRRPLEHRWSGRLWRKAGFASLLD